MFHIVEKYLENGELNLKKHAGVLVLFKDKYKKTYPYIVGVVLAFLPVKQLSYFGNE